MTNLFMMFSSSAWVLLSLYCASQTAVMLLLKLAAVRPTAFWPLFIGANVLTITGIWLFTLALRQIDANVAAAVGIGGTFMAGQLLLAGLFHSRLSMLQIVGVLLIFAGLMFLVLTPNVDPPMKCEQVNVSTTEN